jgi:hypothetical protein
MLDEELLEIVGVGDNEGPCKVIQLNFKGKPVLLVGGAIGTSKDTHAKILRRFLDERGIDYSEIRGRGINRKELMIPSLGGDGFDYGVVGMGRLWVYLNERFGPMEGDSWDYEIGIDQTHEQLAVRELKRIGWTRLD